MNAKKNPDGFHGRLIFDEILIKHHCETSHIETSVQKMINVMNLETIPESNESCENCAYANQYAKLR